MQKHSESADKRATYKHGNSNQKQRRQKRRCASLKYKSHVLRGKKQGKEYRETSTTPIVTGYHHQLNKVSCKPTCMRKATPAPQTPVLTPKYHNQHRLLHNHQQDGGGSVGPAGGEEPQEGRGDDLGEGGRGPRGGDGGRA